MRGVPAECEYGTTKHDRGYIEQSDLIEELRTRVKKLEQKLAEHNGVISQGSDVATNYDSDRFALKAKAATTDAKKKTVSEVRYRGNSLLGSNLTTLDTFCCRSTESAGPVVVPRKIPSGSFRWRSD